MKRLVTLALAGLMLFASTACGGDDDDADVDADDDADADEADAAQPYVEAIATQLREDEIPVEDPAATCVATTMVEAVGVANLEAAAVTEAQLETEPLGTLGVEHPADATAKVADGVVDCDAVEQLRTGLVSQFTNGLGASPLPAEGLECLEQTVSDDEVANSMAAALVEGRAGDIATLLLASIGQCPVVATALLLDGQENVSDEHRACVTGFVEANRELVDAAFGGSDPNGSITLGTQLASACPD